MFSNHADLRIFDADNKNFHPVSEMSMRNLSLFTFSDTSLSFVKRQVKPKKFLIKYLGT